MKTEEWALMISVVALGVSGGIGVAQYRLAHRVFEQQRRSDATADLYVRAKKERLPISDGYFRDQDSDVCIYVVNEGADDANHVRVDAGGCDTLTILSSRRFLGSPASGTESLSGSSKTAMM